MPSGIQVFASIRNPDAPSHPAARPRTTIRLLFGEALAGVIAVGALGGALVCAPAQAQTVEAFGYTTAYRATLELFDGTGSLVATVSTSSPLGVFQGFVSNSD